MLFRRRDPLTFGKRLRLALWPANSWKRSMQYVSKRVLRLSASPHAVAAGFAAGVFASFTPFLGFHFILSFVVAFAIGGNILAAAFGTAVGNPLTFPFIWLSSYELGNLVLGTDAGHVRRHELTAVLAREPLEAVVPLLKPLLVGGLPLGLAFGALSYAIVLWAVKTYQSARRRRLEARRDMPRETGANLERPEST